MSPWRDGDDEKDDWRKTRSRDIERFGVWFIAILLTIIGYFVIDKLEDIKKIGLDNQEITTGLLREGQRRDSTIAFLRRDLQEHVEKHQIIWTKEEWDRWESFKTRIYREWGYFSNTRSGDEVLLNQPMKGDLQ